MTLSHDPNDARHNRVLHIQIGEGAIMSVPRGYWVWRLAHNPDKTPKGFCDDRVLAAGVFESYRYLILNCNRDEAWRRIKIMRAAILANADDDNGPALAQEDER